MTEARAHMKRKGSGPVGDFALDGLWTYTWWHLIFVTKPLETERVWFQGLHTVSNISKQCWKDNNSKIHYISNYITAAKVIRGFKKKKKHSNKTCSQVKKKGNLMFSWSQKYCTSFGWLIISFGSTKQTLHRPKPSSTAAVREVATGVPWSWEKSQWMSRRSLFLRVCTSW